MFGTSVGVFRSPIACLLAAMAQQLETGKEHTVYCKVVPYKKKGKPAVSEHFRSGLVADMEEAKADGFLPYIPPKSFPIANGMATVV